MELDFKLNIIFYDSHPYSSRTETAEEIWGWALLTTQNTITTA